jgi:cation transport ATPase
MTTPFARISITLPARDLAAADRLAARQDRSRSWIVAEAIRRYAAEVEAEVDREVGMVTSHGVPGTVPGPGPGLGASRLVQVQRDLSMTAADRVRAAEAALDEVAVRGGPPGAIEEPRWFGSYEDFAAWRRGRGGG